MVLSWIDCRECRCICSALSTVSFFGCVLFVLQRNSDVRLNHKAFILLEKFNILL